MVDPMLTSAGIVDLPDGYLQELAAEVRASGGLFLADEVQSGFGRSGPTLWRFAASGVVPDLVTLGKPMGNGYPVAAVITRREIADRFARRQEYFSTFAGSAVSAAAALTVLDILELASIPQQAVQVGNYLRESLHAINSPAIRQVRGAGLLAGIELTGDAEMADRVVERLKIAGVLIGTTGRAGNVLKVRPPLIWTAPNVDFFVNRLRAALAAEASLGTFHNFET
ncbi:aminotransferase class III-fold pyridoxal phosphate-dependent enzyme [Nakamurella antarctica]|nr:aminotransferase class III-fold pyridoxal phosphate-dependent enzyme [Nakamurella antarctica]